MYYSSNTITYLWPDLTATSWPAFKKNAGRKARRLCLSRLGGSEVVGDAELHVTRGLEVRRGHGAAGEVVGRLKRIARTVTRIVVVRLALGEHVVHQHVEGQLLVGELRAILGVERQDVLPRRTTGITRTRGLATAEVVVVAVISRVGLERTVQAFAALGSTGGDGHIRRQQDLRRYLVATVSLDLVLAIIRQQAVGVIHQRRVIPVLRGGNVSLTDIRLHLAFGVAVALGVGVVEATEPGAIERMLEVQVQAVVVTLDVREAQFRVVDVQVLEATVAIGHGEVDRATRVEEVATAEVVGRQALFFSFLGEELDVAGVVDGVLQRTVGRLGAVVPLVVEHLVEAQDVFILILRFERLGRHRLRVRRLAVLVVGRDRRARALLRVDRRQASRVAIGRIDAGVGVVRLGEQRAGSTAQGYRGRQREVVTASVGVHLEARIAIDVPAGAKARSPLAVVLLDERLVVAVEVGELVIADTHLDQPAIAYLPGVFQVLSALVDANAGSAGDAVLRHVVTILAARIGSRGIDAAFDRLRARSALVVAPQVAGIAGHLRTVVKILRALVVDTGGDAVIGNLVRQVDAVVGAAGLVLRIGCLVDRLAVADTTRLAAGVQRILVGRGRDEDQVRIEGTRKLLVQVRHLLTELRGQRQVVGQVAGVLGDPHVGGILEMGRLVDEV